jgi:hypothetical protein
MNNVGFFGCHAIRSEPRSLLAKFNNGYNLDLKKVVVSPQFGRAGVGSWNSLTNTKQMLTPCLQDFFFGPARINFDQKSFFLTELFHCFSG